MLHRAVTGRKEGEEKSLLRLILRWFYYEEDKGQKIRRLLSCITGVWVVSFFLSFFFSRFDSFLFVHLRRMMPFQRSLLSVVIFWSSLPTLLLINDTYACVPDSLLWFFSFLLLFWSRCRSGLLCHELFCVFEFARLF